MRLGPIFVAAAALWGVVSWWLVADLVHTARANGDQVTIRINDLGEGALEHVLMPTLFPVVVLGGLYAVAGLRGAR